MSIGERVAAARTEAGLTQAQLASAVGLERSALAKIEVGHRRAGVVELVDIARELNRRVEWFVEPGPPSLASYRNGDPGATQAIDTQLDAFVRDVEFVAQKARGLISDTPEAQPVPTNSQEAEALAAHARSLLGIPASEPLYDLGDHLASIGLFACSVELGDGADAGTTLLPRGGVSIVNGSLHPGKRRLALAHELAHYLVADDYTTDWRVASNEADRTESLFDRFARALLLPAADLEGRWRGWTTIADETLRDAAVRAGNHYRVDMATLTRRLIELGLLSESEAAPVRMARAGRADFVEKNIASKDELVPVWLPRAYEQAVLKLYRGEAVSSDRTLGLLRGAFTDDDLPALPPVPESEIWQITS